MSPDGDGDGYAMSWREGLRWGLRCLGLDWSGLLLLISFVLRLMCSFGGCLDQGDLG